MLKGLKELVAEIRAKADMTEEQVEQELNKLLPETWIPKAKFNELSEAKKKADDSIAELNKTLESLKSDKSTSEDLKKQIADLQEAQRRSDEEYKAQLATANRNHALESALTTAKAKSVKAVRALLDESKIIIADNGEVAGLKEQLEAVQKEHAYLFDTEGPNVPDKPRFGTQGTGTTSDDTLQGRMMAAAGIKGKE